MSTHRINVNARNVDHWSYQIGDGEEVHMPAGSSHVDVTLDANTDSGTSLRVGSMIGVVASIDHQDRNADEDSSCASTGTYFYPFTHFLGTSLFQKYVRYHEHLIHPMVYWSWNGGVWQGVGKVGDCGSSEDASLEHTALIEGEGNSSYALSGTAYKIRYRQLLNATAPSSLSVSPSSKLVTSSTSDQYHSFLPATHMQAFHKQGSSWSKNYNFIEAYIHSIGTAYKLLTPTNFTQQIHSFSSRTISWTAVPSATSFVVAVFYRWNSGLYRQQFEVDGSTLSQRFDNLRAMTIYRFQIFAKGDQDTYYQSGVKYFDFSTPIDPANPPVYDDDDDDD